MSPVQAHNNWIMKWFEFVNYFQAFTGACELSIHNSCHHNKIWMAGTYQGMIILALRE
jgi:hypothetical protein